MKKYEFGILGLVILVVCLALLNTWQYLQPKGRVSCSDFSAYADIVVAYKEGAHWLDGNPKDGIPCNNRR